MSHRMDSATPALPLRFELVGLPGSGKSTLAAMLARAGMRPVTAANTVRPEPWLHAGRAVIGPFLAQRRHIRRRSWHRLSLMVQLELLHQATFPARPGGPDLMFDQGPVYRLSILQRALNEPPGVNAVVFERYWNDLLRRWARTLDAVVLLEADATVLHERILERGTAHRTREVARAMFEQSRSSRERVLAALRSAGGAFRTLEISTDAVSPQEAAERVHAFLTALRHRDMSIHG